MRLRSVALKEKVVLLQTPVPENAVLPEKAVLLQTAVLLETTVLPEKAVLPENAVPDVLARNGLRPARPGRAR